MCAPSPPPCNSLAALHRAAVSCALTTQPIQSPKRHSLALGILLLLFSLPLAKAEEGCGSIHGTVSTSEDAHISGAPVSATNQTTSAVFSVVTKNDGSYQFPKLPVGIYSLAVQLPGFQTTTIYGIKLDADKEFTGKIEMLAGKMTTAVLLPADAPVSSTCKHTKSRLAQSAHYPTTLASP